MLQVAVVPAFNPLARQDAELFQSLMTGERCVRGFTNRASADSLQKSAFGLLHRIGLRRPRPNGVGRTRLRLMMARRASAAPLK